MVYSPLWPFALLLLLLVGIAFSRMLKVLMFPNHTAHDVAVCKERLREMEYRIADVLRELKAIRALLETRQEPAAGREQGITTPPEPKL